MPQPCSRGSPLLPGVFHGPAQCPAPKGSPASAGTAVCTASPSPFPPRFLRAEGPGNGLAQASLLPRAPGPDRPEDVLTEAREALTRPPSKSFLPAGPNLSRTCSRPRWSTPLGTGVHTSGGHPSPLLSRAQAEWRRVPSTPPPAPGRCAGQGQGQDQPGMPCRSQPRAWLLAVRGFEEPAPGSSSTAPQLLVDGSQARVAFAAAQRHCV